MQPSHPLLKLGDLVVQLREVELFFGSDISLDLAQVSLHQLLQVPLSEICEKEKQTDLQASRLQRE